MNVQDKRVVLENLSFIINKFIEEGSDRVIIDHYPLSDCTKNILDKLDIKYKEVTDDYQANICTTFNLSGFFNKEL